MIQHRKIGTSPDGKHTVWAELGGKEVKWYLKDIKTGKVAYRFPSKGFYADWVIRTGFESDLFKKYHK